MLDVEHNAGSESYRLVLSTSHSQRFLAIEAACYSSLPRVRILKGTRPAEQVQRVVCETFGLHIAIFCILAPASSASGLVIAEVYGGNIPHALTATEWSRMSQGELTRRENQRIRGIFGGVSKGHSPFSRPGWIKEVCARLCSTCPNVEVMSKDIRQYNAGARFVLLRFAARDGSIYWFKATGSPNQHEFDLTVFLSKVCPEFLPHLIAEVPEWNGWFMRDAGDTLGDHPALVSLEAAARSLVAMQLRTIRCTKELLKVGAFDQRLAVLRDHIDEITEYLVDAMKRQTSLKVAPLAKRRLMELRQILRDCCDRIDGLTIPDALLHNDLNVGNVLHDGRRCVFIDWSEGAIGNPFLTFERLCLLGNFDRTPLQRLYRDSWKQQIDERSIDQAFTLMPLLAIFAYLYGRGKWLRNAQGRSPHFESYARSLARHMDRAARNPIFLKTLRHRV